MSATTTKSAFWKGARDGTPFVLVVAPFGGLFGVMASEAGLNLVEIMGFSIVVVAGAAQFTALQLMAEEAPTLIVLISALAVNLRMAMYSASLTPHIGAAPLWQRAIAAYLTVDQTYTMSIMTYEKVPQMSVAEKISYFFGVATPVMPAWYLCTLLGALLGQSVPPEMALDFALPITFLAMIGPMLRTAAHLAAAATSVALALVFAFLPFNMGLLVAGVSGMMVGARVELWQSRRALA